MGHEISCPVFFDLKLPTLTLKHTNQKKNAVAAEAIARKADKDEDVSRFFSNCGEMRKPIRPVAKQTMKARDARS
jgi:hypothetical protein